MKVAIAHDFLTQSGGAERVVLQLARMFPDAPVYTSLFNPEGTYPEFRDIEVRTSSLQGRVSPDRFRLAAHRYPGEFAEMELDNFDVVLVSSSAFAHHVRHPNTFVYCHTPPRFLYDLGAYGLSSSPLRLRDRSVKAGFSWMRARDRRAALSARSYRANSAATAERVLEVYGMAVDVLHPPLWTDHLPDACEPLPTSPRALVVSRLLPYKRVDVAIRACAAVGVPLSIVGEGPERLVLTSLAASLGADVTFEGRVPDGRLGELFVGSSLVLVPGVEDFGYLPVEANYAGRPVIAAAARGALETVMDGKNGLLAEPGDVGAWTDAVKRGLATTWCAGTLREGTRRFQSEAFASCMEGWVTAELAAASV